MQILRNDEKWRSVTQVPRNIKKILQAALPKPGKPPAAKNLRPLSMYSVWWRTFEASSLQTRWFAKWKAWFNITGVAYKEAAEEVAAQVSALLQSLGFGGALDYSMAYDHMSPLTTQELLTRRQRRRWQHKLVHYCNHWDSVERLIIAWPMIT